MATDAKAVRGDTVGPAQEAHGPVASSSDGGVQAQSNPPRGWAEEFERKWQYLRTQESFLHSPVNTILRLIFWRAKSFLRFPATMRLDRWGLRMFLPAEWRGFSKLAFVFRERYEPELLYLEQILSPGKTFCGSATTNCASFAACLKNQLNSPRQIELPISNIPYFVFKFFDIKIFISGEDTISLAKAA